MVEVPSGRSGRRLSAIVAADVVGFSRLMGLDEVGTARTLREHRTITDALVAKAYEQVRGKVAVGFADRGEHNLKNIVSPVRAYAVVVRDGDEGRAPRGGTTPISHCAPRLSIIVLPFANMGGNPGQEYFVDRVTESLTTDLSRIGGAFVIARNTAFTFKGKAVDVKQIGRELNFRYVLEGSVQRGGNRFRVNVQLIDAATSNHLWAERFDKPVSDLFDLQDEIVSRLANALDAQLTEEEARRAERAQHPDAMDLYFQGKAWWHKGITPNYLAQSRSFFERALTLDPGHIEAMVGIATIDLALGASFIADNRVAHLAMAEETVLSALSNAPNNALAHMVLGAVQMFTNRVPQGIAEFERALALDGNLADAHGFIGFAKYAMGRATDTETHVCEALRISPRDIFAFRWLLYVGCAKLQLSADTLKRWTGLSAALRPTEIIPSLMSRCRGPSTARVVGPG